MKCFIISPIGQPGTSERRHADAVLECIIKPALQEAKIDGHRADELTDVGKITKQMYDAILASDFCIAVLHEFNPNVFYELAVAHSAGIPVILLSEQGVNLPFDIKDDRVFHYDLSPLAIYRRENERELLKRIESVQKLQGKREVPFGINLVPLNAVGAELPYLLRTDTNETADFWNKFIGQARERLLLAGISLGGWRTVPGMREALARTAESGCKISVLTMDAANPGLRCMLLNPDVTSDPKTEADRTASTREWFREVLKNAPHADIRALRNGMLFSADRYLRRSSACFAISIFGHYGIQSLY